MDKLYKQKEINLNKKNKDRRYTFIIILLIMLSIVFTGSIIAYFSDMTSQSGEVIIGTLKINGNYTFYVNGTETTIDNIKNLNPGDVIVIKANISNNGSKSAWIREKFTLNTTDNSILDYIKIYNGEFTRADFAANNDLSDYLRPLLNGTAVSSNRVINGTGNSAEIENDEDYNYIGNSTYQLSYTIYFLPSAPNEAQGKTFNLTVATQALQFRNNNITEPNEAAWSTVAAVGLK